MDKVTFTITQGSLERFNEVTYLKCYLGKIVLVSLQIISQLDWREKKIVKDIIVV